MFEVTDASSGEVLHVAFDGPDAHEWIDRNAQAGRGYRVVESPYLSMWQVDVEKWLALLEGLRIPPDYPTILGW